MKKSKRWSLSKSGPFLFLILSLMSVDAWAAAASSDGTLTLTKDLVSMPGAIGLQGGNLSLNFVWGESISGWTLSSSSEVLDSGYYGGRFGAGQTFSVLASTVGGSPVYFQNGLQIGVTVQATVQVLFSDQLDPATISAGVSATILQDHQAQAQNVPAPIQFSYDSTGRILLIRPLTSWLGNTVYDIALSPSLQSINGYPLAGTTHILFLTMADPHEPNVVVNALLSGNPSTASSSLAQSTPLLRVEMASDSFADYSVILFNTAPLQTPWHVDPSILQDATRKAQSSGGTYETPVGLLEIEAYNPAGQLLNTLSQPAQISISYDSTHGWMNGTPAPVHSTSLALWALDEEHHLWVKIPASASAGQLLTAPITRLSVFALMGSASGSASDVYVFPIPWRPSGPNAGSGAGQTGTDSEGMTFSNLPSECTIKIYTLDGHQVRELHHSDTAGPIAQEKWDGHTSGGAHAASGVYLWRVESTQDGKNGKLMIIR